MFRKLTAVCIASTISCTAICSLTNVFAEESSSNSTIETVIWEKSNSLYFEVKDEEGNVSIRPLPDSKITGQIAVTVHDMPIHVTITSTSTEGLSPYYDVDIAPMEGQSATRYIFLLDYSEMPQDPSQFETTFVSPYLTQIYNASYNITISGTSRMVVQGNLIVEEGASINVTKGGLLYVYGNTASATIAGTVTSNGVSIVKYGGTDFLAGVTIDLTDAQSDESVIDISGTLQSRACNDELAINLVKNAFCCPKCGFSGGMLDLYGFYAKMDRSKAYRAILEKLQLDSQTVKMERARKKQQAAVNEYPLTGIEERDATYRAFLNRLSLASDHRANLMERGLNDEVIQQNLYRTTPAGGYEAIAKQLLLEGHYLAGVPGFYRKEGVWTYCGTRRGILLPVRDYFGRIQGIKVRLDNVARRKFRWLSTAEMPDGCKAEAWAHVAGDAQDTILLIEGPLKADIVHYLTGMTLVAVSGVGSLTHLQQTLTVMQEQGVRKVMTAFDMDYLVNPHVRAGQENLAHLLDRCGISYGTYLWDPRYKGLDDYIWGCLCGPK